MKDIGIERQNDAVSTALTYALEFGEVVVQRIL